MHPWGVPGEEHKIIVAPIFKGAVHLPSKEELNGERGGYRVQLLLARPGYSIRGEREHKFIDNVVGNSHIRFTKPELERGPNDPEQMLVRVLGKNYIVRCLANKEGFLGKLVCELEADNAEAAETDAYGAVTPFLSAWSINTDVPINVETIQVTNLATHASFLRCVTPHFEMNIGGGTQL